MRFPLGHVPTARTPAPSRLGLPSTGPLSARAHSTFPVAGSSRRTEPATCLPPTVDAVLDTNRRPWVWAKTAAERQATLSLPVGSRTYLVQTGPAASVWTRSAAQT